MKALCRVLAILVLLLGVHLAAPSGAQNSVWGRSVAAFTPDAPVLLSVYRGSRPLFTDFTDVAVYALSVDEAVALAHGARALDGVLAERRPVAERHEQQPERIDLGRLPPGLYVCKVHTASGISGTPLFTVSTIGVMATQEADANAVVAIDLRTLHRRSDVTFVHYPAAEGPVHARRADPLGVTRLGRGAADGSDVVVARADDGSAAVLRSNDSSAARPEIGFVHTDRPIYRPGQRMFYRAVVRRGADGAYALPAGERTIRLRDPNNKVILTAKRTLDAFGTLSGEVALADDAVLGAYSLDVDDVQAGASFTVAAYKKPEYLLDISAPRSTVGGDDVRVGVAARYFFGRPVAGMKLHYRAMFQPAHAWWRRGSPFLFTGYVGGNDASPDPPDREGEAVADAAGRATIVVPTNGVTDEKLLSVEVDGRDDSGTTVTAERRTQVTPASFYLTVAPKAYFTATGDTVEVIVRSFSYDAKAARPHVPLEVTFVRRWWTASSSLGEHADATQRVVTDENGAATVRWQSTHGGSYEVRARAVDERGHLVASSAGVWIASRRYDYAYTFTTATIVPQKAEYRPGERASFLVTVPQGDVDALVRVIGGGHERVSVRRLTAATSTIDVEPPPDAARYRVDVTVPTRQGLRSAATLVDVVPAPHKLDVEIRPEKAKYEPGDPARFAIRVRDAAGKPMRAEIGLAVVDDAIFALRPAAAADPFATFYQRTLSERSVGGSWASVDDPLTLYQPLQLIGRTVSRSASALFAPRETDDASSIERPSFAALRSDFRDTAYWSPSVITGADGRAIVSFVWPDSLTSYTASGLAVTAQSDIGNGVGAALVTKDLLVRLSAPRFLRSGDAAQLVAIAQGTRTTRTAQLRFSAPQLGVADETALVRFDGSTNASTRWDVRGGELGDAMLRLAGTSGALHDGLRIALPVETSGTPVHERRAGTVSGDGTVALRLPGGADAGDLRLDLAPSIVMQLVANARLLGVYPYSCVEQTMSAALPAIYVDRMRKRSSLPAPDGPQPVQIARKAVDRLKQLQHFDGSWGWWEHDPANPFMTAYALYGLAELARDGYAVPKSVIDGGALSLEHQLRQSGDTLRLRGGPQRGSEWNTRAFMLFALADAKPAAVPRDVLASTDERAADLNPYALSVLGLAHLTLGDRDGAKPLLAELKRRVSDDGTIAHWAGEGWHYGWEDDPIETTAYALRFVHAMDAGDGLTGRALLWLRAQQRGSWFETTKDTAAAIYAMSETMAPSSGELSPHETVRVFLDGRLLRTVAIDSPVLSRADASLVVPARLLRRGGTLHFERVGTGALYWSSDWTQYVQGDRAPDPKAALAVERAYRFAGAGDTRIGDTVDVNVTVTARSDVEYVAIEDPLPAGLQYQPKQHESGDAWSGMQFFDDRVVFFATHLWSGQRIVLTYRLRATTAGTFTAPAPSAYAVYGPPSTAVGKVARISIRG